MGAQVKGGEHRCTQQWCTHTYTELCGSRLCADDATAEVLPPLPHMPPRAALRSSRRHGRRIPAYVHECPFLGPFPGGGRGVQELQHMASALCMYWLVYTTLM
jgi:hypothetical protein